MFMLIVKKQWISFKVLAETSLFIIPNCYPFTQHQQ